MTNGQKEQKTKPLWNRSKNKFAKLNDGKANGHVRYKSLEQVKDGLIISHLFFFHQQRLAMNKNLW
jgi:hypothetical protein